MAETKHYKLKINGLIKSVTCQHFQKKKEVALLISDSEDFKIRKITRNKEERYNKRVNSLRRYIILKCMHLITEHQTT